MRNSMVIKKQSQTRTIGLVMWSILFTFLFTINLTAQRKGGANLDANINGENVGLVTEQYRTSVQHTWTQTADKNWTRTAVGSTKTLDLQETGRDVWSVYLKDMQGNAFQIDLWQKKVTDKSTGAVGDIVKVALRPSNTTIPKPNSGISSFSKKVNAGNLKAITFSKNGQANGSFENIGDKKWGEFKNGEKTIHAEFEENRRDKFSVYLKDRKRGINARLDLHTKKVYINNSPLYDITSTSADMVLSGYTVGKVKIEGQTFVKTFNKEWQRLSSRNKIENVYLEKSRNRKTVNLVSKYGKVERIVKIDVQENKVFSDTKGAGAMSGKFTSQIKNIEVRPAILIGVPPTKLMDGGTVGKKSYILTSVENRTKIIDIHANGKTNGTKVNFWGRKADGNNFNQLFWFSPVSKHEFMMVPHHKIDTYHESLKGYSAISFSKSNPKRVALKGGRKMEGSESKPNSDLSIQLFKVDNGSMNSEETHVAIKTKKGYFTILQGQLIITEKYQGIPSTFVFEKTNIQGAPLELFSEQYAAPVPIAPLTAAQVKSINTVIMEDGKLEKYLGTKVWLRKNKSGTTIDILKETSRKNGQIYLKTENNLSSAFPLSRKITDLIITSNYVLNHNSIIVDFVESTNANTIKWAAGYGYLNILKFRGMVVMMYASNKETFTNGCSGGAPREKELFKKACDSHDDNWAAPWKMAGYSNEVGKKISDAIFLTDMKKIGDNFWDDGISAGAFYRAVRSTDEAQNNFKQSRIEESSKHVMLYKPEKKIKDGFAKIVETEYADDVLDDIINFIGDTKTFFEDTKTFFEEDVVGFFEDIF